MASGGFESDLTIPHPGGDRVSSETGHTIRGIYGGRMRMLNVFNPQSGYEYAWRHVSNHDQLNARMDGGELVRWNDPEGAGHPIRNDMGGQADEPIRVGDVVLMRFPEHRQRERREEEVRAAERERRAAGADFEARASAAEIEAGHGRRTRYRIGGPEGDTGILGVEGDA